MPIYKNEHRAKLALFLAAISLKNTCFSARKVPACGGFCIFYIELIIKPFFKIGSIRPSISSQICKMPGLSHGGDAMHDHEENQIYGVAEGGGTRTFLVLVRRKRGGRRS